MTFLLNFGYLKQIVAKIIKKLDYKVKSMV
jgi:hypothetical protein